MKVLLSAYACEPGKGSEPEVGLRTMLAAARRHDVWVLTRDNNLPALHDHLNDLQLRDRITLVGLDVPGLAMRLKKQSTVFSQLYYDQWQRAAARRALDLDTQIGFDVVHHATFAAYWKRAGVAVMDKPLVWGPVGGGVTAPPGLLGSFGVRGLIEEVVRHVVRPAASLVPGIRRPQRSATVILTQNRETARALRTRTTPIVLPNAVAVTVPDAVVPAQWSGMS